MSDHTPPPATPAPNNQNLVVGIVLGAMVLVLFFLLFTQGGALRPADGPSSEIAGLRQELDAKRAAINSERARLGLPPIEGGASGLTAAALATRISDDSRKLGTLVGRMQNALAEVEAKLRTEEATTRALTQQIAGMQAQIDESRLGTAQAQTLRNDLANAQALLEAANQTTDDLRARLAAAPDESTMAALRQSLDEAAGERDQAISERDTVRAQLDALREEAKGMVDATRVEDYRRLKEKLAALVPETNQLRYEIQRLQAELDRTRLFVETADDLPAPAKILFNELAKLEAAGPGELQAEYARLNEELKARVVDKIAFQTGSSQIDLDRAEGLRRSTEAASPDSLFLVVGYASNTGDLASNKKLSAQRATTIASITNVHLKDTQGVRAVFLGQTGRFSSSDPSRNQVCEVWEIGK